MDYVQLQKDIAKFNADVSAVVNEPQSMRAFGIRCNRIMSDLEYEIASEFAKGMSIKNSVEFWGSLSHM